MRTDGRRLLGEMTQAERIAATQRPARAVKPDSLSRLEVRQEVYYGVRTRKGKVRSGNYWTPNS